MKNQIFQSRDLSLRALGTNSQCAKNVRRNVEKMQRKRVELLAPAGNAEGFYGAIHAGADAVYLGGSRFGARAYADNFTTEELNHCIRYAHLWGRKVYLTVNTLVRESEFADIYGYLMPFYKAGLDGVIVQDVGVFAYIRDHFPGLELHVSTQMTLTGVHGARLMQKMGACRIVPARELSLEEIRQIKKETGLEIETFVHGAMCYCYSGQCLFSSILGGRSGNRGRCAQPCRLPYQVTTPTGTSNVCYPLSLKDMCTVERIPELIEAGIDSFKIEGRMKKPEYTAGVTAIYRKYIDRYYAGNKKMDADDLRKLSHLYIRSERQDGYYYKQHGRDMVALDNPAYSGSDEALLNEIRENYLQKKPKLPISVYADFTVGEKCSLTILQQDLSVTVYGETVVLADRQPVTKDKIEKQLNKLGDSIFFAETMEVTVGENAFIPIGAINELRRKAVEELENQRIEAFGLTPYRKIEEQPVFTANREEKQPENTEIQNFCMTLSVHREEQLGAVLDFCQKKSKASDSIGRVYLDCKLFETDGKAVLEKCRKLPENWKRILALPYIIRQKDMRFLAETILPMLTEENSAFYGVQVRSAEGMGILRETGYTGKIFTDAGFYVWNRVTLREWENSETGRPDVFCLPLELSGAQQRELLPAQIPCEKIIYGRAPMMITANCVANTTTGCLKNRKNEVVRLTDRYRKVFPVELNCRQCLNMIYNSVPLSLHGEVDKWKHRVDLRLDFTVESEQETIAVLKYFTEIYCRMGNPSDSKPPYKEYTTGHEKRGVE